MSNSSIGHRRADRHPITAALRPATLLGLSLICLAACSEPSPTATAAEAPATTPASTTGPATAQMGTYGVDISLETSTLAATQPDTARLFVYLREPGERMPLAVTQFSATEIPPAVRFELDRPYAQVEAIARLSASGTVNAQPEDLETQVATAVTQPPTKVVMSFADARAPRPATAASKETAASTAAAVSTATAAAPSTSTAAPGLTITLEYAIRGELPPSTTVFVVAKAPDSPMPVAAKRLQLGDLPTVITLTDADSMIATRRISTTSGLTVSAHISRSGTAGRQPGDWTGQGVQDPDQPNSYTVTIDEPL